MDKLLKENVNLKHNMFMKEQEKIYDDFFVVLGMVIALSSFSSSVIFEELSFLDYNLFILSWGYFIVCGFGVIIVLLPLIKDFIMIRNKSKNLKKKSKNYD